MNTSERLDNQSSELFGQTPAQTVGPFFHYGLPWKGGADLVGSSCLGARTELFPDEHYIMAVPRPRGEPLGEVIEISGHVLDGDNAPVPDAMLEIWQANSAGRYDSPEDNRSEIPVDASFVGFGRSSTDEEGLYRFRTIRPGRVPGPGNALQAPHIAVSVLGRGLLKRLVTRIYFQDSEGLETDTVLSMVPASRRGTLIAQPDGENGWRFDIVLQGDRETVFFEL